jgi:hypothetical protein
VHIVEAFSTENRLCSTSLNPKGISSISQLALGSLSFTSGYSIYHYEETILLAQTAVSGIVAALLERIHRIEDPNY